MSQLVTPFHQILSTPANTNDAQDMVPALVDAIKSHGLALVVDKSGEKQPDFNPLADPFPRLPKGVDGLLKGNGILRFNESIDV